MSFRASKDTPIAYGPMAMDELEKMKKRERRAKKITETSGKGIAAATRLVPPGSPYAVSRESNQRTPVSLPAFLPMSAGPAAWERRLLNHENESQRSMPVRKSEAKPQEGQ